MGTDASDRERVEASYHALLDNLNEVVFKTDHRGRFTYLNEAWRSLTGRMLEESLGTFCGRAVVPIDRASSRRPLLALLHGEISCYRCEVRVLRADGTMRWTQISTRRLERGGTLPSGLVGTIVDISAAKQAEEQLLAAKQEAEAANRAKSEFLSTMSHELRTPLNAVIGLSESLLESGDTVDSERTRRYLGLINEAGRKLFREIADVLDVARLEAGRIKPNVSAVDLGLLCASECDAIRADAAAKQLRTELRRPGDPLVVEVDARLIAQAVHKLLANAVKFTPEGGRVTISVARREAGWAEIQVADTGIGIAPEDLKRLFKPFTQVDASLSRRYGGVGLGLVLVDKLVRLHGGSVRVVSQPRLGSTFTMVLPLRSAHVAAGPGPEQSSTAFPPCR